MKCGLCPRLCPRRPGFCGAGELPRVFRWGPHFGEEPPVTGERGSGCVFFSRCTMKCIYCQNSPWSWKGGGRDVSVAGLADILRGLAVDDRVENWNLVSPTPYLPSIREAAKMLEKEGVRLPFVWNSSGYERVETLQEYSDLCDLALFDLRYSRDETASAASQARDYVGVARNAVKWAGERTATSSSALPRLLGRILVLPGHAEEAVENLAWLAAECSNDVHVSVMSQYTPVFHAKDTPPFDRVVTEDEYGLDASAAEDFGLAHGWFQGAESRSVDLDLLGESMPSGHGTVGA